MSTLTETLTMQIIHYLSVQSDALKWPIIYDDKQFRNSLPLLRIHDLGNLHQQESELN